MVPVELVPPAPAFTRIPPRSFHETAGSVSGMSRFVEPFRVNAGSGLARRTSSAWLSGAAFCRLAAEQRAHFRLAEPAVPPGGPDAADAAGCRPPSYRLRVYSEERSHLPGSEKALIVPIHVLPLLISVSEHVFSVAKTSVYFLVFPKNETLVFVVSFRQARPACAGRGAGEGAGAHPDGCVGVMAARSRWRRGACATRLPNAPWHY